MVPEFDIQKMAEVAGGRSRRWPKSQVAEVAGGRSRSWRKSKAQVAVGPSRSKPKSKVAEVDRVRGNNSQPGHRQGAARRWWLMTSSKEVQWKDTGIRGCSTPEKTMLWFDGCESC